MAFQIFSFLLVICLILCLALLWRLCWLHLQPSHSRGRAIHSTTQRLLRPRTPLDCPACRLSCIPSPGMKPAPAPVRPWSEVKSRRGAPKRIPTEGFACPNPRCPYFGITDASIHALVGDGTHGRAEQIQTFRGPACHATFWNMSRRETSRAQRAPLAGGREPDLRSCEEKLPASQAGSGDPRDASGDQGRSQSRLTGIGPLWQVEHRLY